MVFHGIKTTGIEPREKAPKIIAYEPMKEQGIILTHASDYKSSVFESVVFSKHNCEVFDRRIEKNILEEEKEALENYKAARSLGKTCIVTLVFLNLCSIGELNFATCLLEAGVFVFFFQLLCFTKKNYTLSSYRVRLLKQLKEDGIQLTEEEINLLSEEERILYEKKNELSIGNALIVCNPKVLKKRFGEK